MDNDDLPVGRMLNRREVLALVGAGALLLPGCTAGQSNSPAPATASQPSVAGSTRGAATGTQAALGGAIPTSATPAGTTAATAIPACVVVPALTEGPYFVDEKLNRSDIRTDPSDGTTKPGAALALIFKVSQMGSGGCAPLAGASVDVWQCDALGVYSDVSDPGFNTKGKKFLRGYQITDASGTAGFTTIYPGWYQGRAVHIHFKIRGRAGTGPAHEFTSQLFFDDALTDQVHEEQPYAQKAQGRLRSSGDGIYNLSQGQTLLTVTKTDQGYAGIFDVGLQIG